MAEDRKAPVTRKPDGKPAEVSSSGEIDAFLKQARALGAPSEGRGRLIFALDATMSPAEMVAHAVPELLASGPTLASSALEP